ESTDTDQLDRDAFFVGLGDAVMPGVMVASAAFFAPAPPLFSGFALSLPALSAMAGTICGLIVLLWLVMKGRAHAGLPLLNGGAILGYLLGAVLAGIPLIRALGLGPYL
ncbi:MAG TPA: presenilin family intramembrane aspartyl protease, partial [Halococcus sp.]|nr:presenilin family intramembrane aspartyl protease [Halococcus sp.]